MTDDVDALRVAYGRAKDQLLRTSRASCPKRPTTKSELLTLNKHAEEFSARLNSMHGEFLETLYDKYKETMREFMVPLHDRIKEFGDVVQGRFAEVLRMMGQAKDVTGRLVSQRCRKS